MNARLNRLTMSVAAAAILLAGAARFSQAVEQRGTVAADVDNALAYVTDLLDRGARLREAGELLNELLNVAPDNPEVHVQHARHIMKSSGVRRNIDGGARVAWRSGVIERTQAALDRALAIDPDRPDTLVLNAYVAMQRGEFDAALAMLKRAEDGGTENPWLAVNRGTVLIEAGQANDDPDHVRDGLAMLDKALRRTPVDPGANYSAGGNVAAYYLRERRLDEADDAFQALIAHGGQEATARLDYALFLLNWQDNPDAASDQALRALGQGSSRRGRQLYAHALCLKASRLLVEQGDRAAAWPLFDEARRRYKNLLEIAEFSVWAPRQRVMLQGLSEYGVDIFGSDADRYSPLIHTIVQSGDPQFVRTALSLGADPNLDTRDFGTPLHAALFASKPDVLEVLLEAGADPKALYRGNRAPIDIARTSRSSERDRLVALLEGAMRTSDAE